MRDSLGVVSQLAEDKGGVMRAEKKAELARNLQLRNEAAARHHAACASLQSPRMYPEPPLQPFCCTVQAVALCKWDT